MLIINYKKKSEFYGKFHEYFDFFPSQIVDPIVIAV